MRAFILWGTVAFLRFCGSDGGSERAAEPARRPAPEATGGGQVEARVESRAEVEPLPGGRLRVRVEGGRAGSEAPARSVRAAVRDGEEAQPVALRWDVATGAYEGVVAGVGPGAHPVELLIEPASEGPAYTVVTAPVTLTAALPLPRARHGGRVVRVADRTVEVVTSRGGDVALFWMDPEGTPLERPGVSVPSVAVTVGGAARIVPLRSEGGMLRGHVDLPEGEVTEVLLPTLTVEGVVYGGFRVERPVLVASLPAVVVAPAEEVVAVRVRPYRERPRPVWVVEEPAPAVVVVPGYWTRRGHPGHGWGRGYGGGRWHGGGGRGRGHR